MKFTLALAALATLAAHVAADGTIRMCSGRNGDGTCGQPSYVPPKNGNGKCVTWAGASATQVSADSGYCFTVYTTSNCGSGARKVPTNWINGPWKALSYDRC
ncbi:hypothetical protein EJ04DRAFT_529225 [Polyplosphaeria fusca]|uniref:Uncharacterized protein n=1 Tax=Polyplosphaeria fusca TaxID=682080 RepID=A0A9P4QJY4_9PLEO|nr:hypothetical protein EJ04DRAFT_529225 [Polyplosphaeria fusca]